MRFHDFNPDSAKPILHLAHANGFPPLTYSEAVQPLLPNFHVLSFYARPLWGNSPPESLGHWLVMVDDLLKAFREKGISKAIGVGHSMGGVLTLYAAVKSPELFSQIILIDPTMLSPKFLWKVRWMRFWGVEARNALVQGALRRKRTWESAQAAYDYFKSRPLFKSWPDETVRVYAESMTGPSPEGGVQLIYPPEWEARIYRTIPTDVWSYAQRIRIPTLVIRGEHSNTFTAESERAFRKANPLVTFQTVENAGHLVPQEKPGEVGAIITDFLKEN